MRQFFLLATIPVWFLAAIAAPSSAGPAGELRVEIHAPERDTLLSDTQVSVEVRGGASIFGGVQYLDLIFVLDTSKSLQRTDPKDYRAKGAIGLVQALPARSDIHVGVVGFDSEAELLAPLTSDRGAVVRALSDLDRKGTTDLSDGIRTGLAAFESGSRPDSSRVMLLFTDGKSDRDDAIEAMALARDRGVAIHTLQLGSNKKGAAILKEIATGTSGSFIHVTNPSKLPEAFLELRTTGVEAVSLRVNDSAPIPTQFLGGQFSARVPVRIGENEIVAVATSLDGEVREDAVRVFVSGPLAVSIDSPADGHVFTEHEGDTTIEGTVAIFANPTPELLARHPDRGISRVVLHVDGLGPYETELVEGQFRGRVPLRRGDNQVTAVATASDGRRAEDAVALMLRFPGCGELQITAERDGKQALSLSDRAVELIVDASNSMWAQIGDRPKISIAKKILGDALEWMPSDLNIALRVYGHQYPRKQHNCRDSQLLVPLAPDNRGRVRDAIASFKPRGQTPIGYSLEQVPADLGRFKGERAVVLVTDGIESCGGDPVEAARKLQELGHIPVHVIGFGLGDSDEDTASLRAIAEVSGGRYLSARNADELRRALSATVGTPFAVLKEGETVASGALGGEEAIRLPAGDYTVKLESEPPYEIPVTIIGEQSLTLMLKRQDGTVYQASRTRSVPYATCSDVAGTEVPGWLPAAVSRPPRPVAPLSLGDPEGVLVPAALDSASSHPSE